MKPLDLASQSPRKGNVGGAHFRKVLLGQPALINLAKIVAYDLAGDLDREVDNLARKLDHGLLALGTDGTVNLSDDPD